MKVALLPVEVAPLASEGDVAGEDCTVRGQEVGSRKNGEVV